MLLLGCFGNLLSDTKLRKNIRKQVIGCYLSSDLTKIVQRLPDIHRHKIARDTRVHAGQHPVKGFVGLCKALVMAKVGDEHIALFYLVDLKAGEDFVFQELDIFFCEAGDQNKVFSLLVYLLRQDRLDPFYSLLSGRERLVF